MTTKLVSPKKGDMKFKVGETQEKGEKFIPSKEERGRISTQESEDETGLKSPTRRGLKSGRQGEFSGAFDKEGHHLKSDGTPDMRFKENREEYSGQGYEYTSPQRLSKLGAQLKSEKEEEMAKRSPGRRSPIPRELKSGRLGEFSGAFDKKGHHLKADRTPDMRFKENREEFSGEGYEYTSPKRFTRTGVQFKPEEREAKEEEAVRRTSGRRSPIPREFKSGRQGEFSGAYDRKGHHLKADGSPDMRFKENREEFSGEGYEYTSPKRFTRTGDQFKPEEREEKEEMKRKPQKGREKEGEEKFRRPNTRTPEKHTKKEKEKEQPSAEHLKSDGTPDMRFKENRDQFSGQGYEGLTSRGGGRTSTSKANMGIFEGNVPGEHSGKFDSRGHHLKADGTPDMRFKENREEYSGQGFESPRDETGATRKSAKYMKDEEKFTEKIYYRRKRPPTPYAIYIRENASEMKKKHPDMDMNEVFRELGAKWKKSSKKEHQKYYDMYNEEVKRFQYTNQFPHRGPLATRKFAEEHGFGYHGTSTPQSKRPRNYRRDRKIDEEDEDREEENQRDEDEENLNPNEAITA